MGAIHRNNVKVLGSGEQTIVLAHGYGCDQSTWRHVYPALTDKYKVVLFDYVGSGLSDANAFDSSRYSTVKGYGLDIVVSIVGWLVVGIPAVLMLSPRRILRASLMRLLTVGVLLGPAALLVIFLLLSLGMPKAETFTNTGLLWASSSLISTVPYTIGK